MPEGRKSYYQLLGVLRDASAEDIRRAYYEAAHRLHPDKNKLPGETEIFLEVQQAYEVLSNAQRRAQYDATLPPDEPVEDPVIWKAQYSRPNLVHISEPQLIYALLDVSPRLTARQTSAPPLNICLVIDRSTSMQGEKLDLAKAAAMEIMRNLRQEDLFSVVAFSDRAEVLVPASLQMDRTRLQSRIQGVQAGGGTEIFQGLLAGVEEVRRGADEKRLNHVLLLTDGHTYGDEQDSLQLAQEAGSEGIGISGFGVGGEWNDIFLDALAGKTGNNSTYIAKPEQMQRLLVDKFHALTNMYADESLLQLKPADDVVLSYAFRLKPEPGPIALGGELQLGPILQDTNLTVLLEYMVEPSAAKGNTVVLLDGKLRVSLAARPTPAWPVAVRLERPAADEAGSEPPPPAILEALARLTLYRLQERARQEAEVHEFEAATRHLKNLAALLLTQGQKDLAKTALLEAEQTERMQSLSSEGGKEIKYGTRALFGGAAENRK